MKCQHILVAFSSLLFINAFTSISAMTLQSLDSQLALLNTCQPCGDLTLYQSHSELLLKIRMSYYTEGGNVVNALIKAMQDAQITSLAHSAFNLEECCGYPAYIESVADLSEMNNAEIVSNIMLVLQDVITLNRAPSLDAANIRDLNSTLCALETLDPTGKVEDCLRPSPILMCTRGFTCDSKITLSFLKSSYEMFKYLINSL